MKLRCPHCKQVFDTLVNFSCPACGKGLRIQRGTAEGGKGVRLPRRTPRARREKAAIGGGVASPFMVPFLVFAKRPRVFFWVLATIVVVAGKLLVTRVDTVQAQPRSRVQQAESELRVLRTALEWFRADCKRYPTSQEGLKALVRNPGIDDWHGNYIDALPTDVWGHPYQYTYTTNGIRLWSLGPDGATNTADDVAAPGPDYKELMERIDIKDLPRAPEAPARGNGG